LKLTWLTFWRTSERQPFWLLFENRICWTNLSPSIPNLIGLKVSSEVCKQVWHIRIRGNVPHLISGYRTGHVAKTQYTKYISKILVHLFRFQYIFGWNPTIRNRWRIPGFLSNSLQNCISW
jgi:hypothetical protein